MHPVKVLLLGGSGQLGSEIRKRWSSDEITAPSHEALDIADATEIAAAVDRGNIDAIVNCAAFHNVDQCEAEPEKALHFNADAVDGMAQVAQERDITFVTISTDYVFDGAKGAPYVETDEPHPLSKYAESKLAGERLVLDRKMKAFVVRTCGVYGPAASKSKGTFIDRVIRQAQNGEEIRVVNDVVASPTFAGDLAGALRQLLDTTSFGLFHAVNEGAITWFDFVREALLQSGLPRPIVPIKAADWKVAARRPSYSALANEKLNALEIRMAAWQEGIAGYLRAK
jgi:dTDP-4-dehydrorhamnose reductase